MMAIRVHTFRDWAWLFWFRHGWISQVYFARVEIGFVSGNFGRGLSATSAWKVNKEFH